ncbi:MAG: SHOCT domain-containing protein [Gemmataceae bacterium]
MYRIGLKPGKAASALGMVVGGLFVILGITVIVPVFGPFGLVWTAAAAAIVLFNAYNVFSRRGVSAYQIDVDSTGGTEDVEGRLRELAKLKADALISDEEYEQKRAQIIRGL